MFTHESIGGCPRFEAAMPVLCTAQVPWRPFTRSFAGKTHTVGTGGLAIVLPQALEPETPVSVRLWQSDPLDGRIVWVGRGSRSEAGNLSFPHGMAFVQPVDAAQVAEWLSLAKRRPTDRVPVRFDVAFTAVDDVRHGTCRNLSRGGMFIATPDPALPGTPLLLRFALPEEPVSLGVHARVVWARTEEISPGAERGMGVQFVDVDPADAMVIGAFVDRLREQDTPGLSASGSLSFPSA